MIMQTQCWICPHCFDDAHHKSDANGCEWQYKQDAIDAARYRFIRQTGILQGVFDLALPVLKGSDLDDSIDKAMESA